MNNDELKGSWDSFNVIEMKVDDQSKKITYKLNTTVLIEMKIKNDRVGDVDLSGFMKKTREDSQKLPESNLDEFHLAVVGRLVEDMETYMRQQLDTIYIAKTKMVG